MMHNYQIHKKLKQLLHEHVSNIKDQNLKNFIEKNSNWRELFESYRIGEQCAKGLKLTPKGLKTFSLIWRSWEIPTAKPYDQWPLVLLWLDRTQTLPYYIDAKQVVFFDENTAVWVKLNGADLAKIAKQCLNSNLGFLKNGP